MLEKYARLIVRTGVSVQKDQIVVITAPVENYEMVEIVTEIAYLEGAREVIPNWIDEKMTRSKYLHAPDEIFDEFPEYKKAFYMENVKKDACYIRLSGNDPDMMEGIDQNKIMRVNKAFGKALLEYRERMMSNRNAWCVASAPTRAWAQKMFPDDHVEEAVEKLWTAIFKTNRVDTEDPVKAWDRHLTMLESRMDFLNKHHFKKLVYSNSLGTDVEIELPEKHIWLGGADTMDNGVKFVANLPTEEVFTLPKKDGVNGIVYSSKPFVYNGVLIDNFNITFKDGKVMDYQAERGAEALKSLVELDEGSCYLGEVALVPFHSPISEMNLLFYNTLFDENASCHLALGEAYPISVVGGEDMSKEELAANYVNTSIAHEDFMIGTADLRIVGYTYSGEEIVVFENGDFAFES
jgi:aminopeptidase